MHLQRYTSCLIIIRQHKCMIRSLKTRNCKSDRTHPGKSHIAHYALHRQTWTQCNFANIINRVGFIFKVCTCRRRGTWIFNCALVLCSTAKCGVNFNQVGYGAYCKSEWIAAGFFFRFVVWVGVDMDVIVVWLCGLGLEIEFWLFRKLYIFLKKL